MDDLSKLWTAFPGSLSHHCRVSGLRGADPEQDTGILCAARADAQYPGACRSPRRLSTTSRIYARGRRHARHRRRNFLGDDPNTTKIMFDGGDGVPPDVVQAGAVKLALPSSLFAGVCTVQVARDVDFGVPTDPHSGFNPTPRPSRWCRRSWHLRPSLRATPR